MDRSAATVLPATAPSDTARTTTDKPDLAQAVQAAQRGDEQAFRVLYRDLQPRLLRYLRTMVADDAEDVASEAWLLPPSVLSTLPSSVLAQLPPSVLGTLPSSVLGQLPTAVQSELGLG